MNYSTFLEQAFVQAHLAKERGDYPIGAVLVNSLGEIICEEGEQSNKCFATFKDLDGNIV